MLTRILAIKKFEGYWGMNEIAILFEKIDKITADLHDIKVAMATRQGQQHDIKRNRDDIDNHAIMLAQLNTKMMIFGTAIIVLIPTISAIVFKALKHSH